MAARRRRVSWTPQARRHLDEAAEYIAQDSVSSARRLVDEALRSAASLEMLSERGRVVPELQSSSTREILLGSYRLIYEVGPDDVTILAFIHGARDLAAWARGHL